MRLLFLLCALGVFWSGAGQKVIQKSIDNADIQFFTIDTSNCFKIVLNTSDSNVASVQALVEGVDYEDVIVKIAEEGNTMLISAGYQPNYQARGSKFGALTYVSIELRISLPKNSKVNVYGTSTNVFAKGSFAAMNVTLADGNCLFDGRFESVKARTQNGDITVKSATGQVTAQSTYGKVFLEELPQGISDYSLNSIEGNIHVSRTN